MPKLIRGGMLMAAVLMAAVLMAACGKGEDSSQTTNLVVRTPRPEPTPGAASPAEFAPEYKPETGGWSDFRGPDRAGVSAETGLLDAWPPEGPPVIWSVEGLGRGFGSVTFSGDRLFVQGTDEESSVVFALSTEDGATIWKTALGPIHRTMQSVGPHSTPVTDGEYVYALTSGGVLAKLAAADGSVLWKFSYGEKFGSPTPMFGFSESPLVRQGRVFIAPGGECGAFVALDAGDGEVIWRSEKIEGGAPHSSLIWREVDGIPILLGFTAEAAVGLSPETGEPYFTFSEPSNTTANATTPITMGEYAFFTSNYEAASTLLRLTRAEDDSIEAERVYSNFNLRNHLGGVIYAGGYFYGAHNTVMRCVRASDGKMIWANRSVGKASILLAGDRLYLQGEGGEVALAKVSSEKYEETGRFKLEDRGQPTLANPAILEGRLYIRNTDQLTCYDIRIPAQVENDTGGGAG
jgi:outer membrane protein assembly factor BamB